MVNWYRVFKIDPKVEKFVRADAARKQQNKANKIAKKNARVAKSAKKKK